jgi:5-methylcytosine-specific restriction enzyme subunit McrC
MMAYGRLYKAPRLTLLYPHHDGMGQSEGRQALHRVGAEDAWLETTSFDVSFGNDAPARLRMLLIGQEPGAA